MASKWIAAIDQAIANLIITNDWYYSLHNTDPGTTGAGRTTVVPAVQILHTGWNAYTTDGTTGGQSAANSAQVNFGNASGVDTLTHIGVWNGDPAAAGVFQGGAPLASAVTTSTGQPVTIPAGNLQVIGAGL